MLLAFCVIHYSLIYYALQWIITIILLFYSNGLYIMAILASSYTICCSTKLQSKYLMLKDEKFT